MRTATVFLTDGRLAPLVRTVSSWDDMAQYPWDRVVMINDSADPEYAAKLAELFPDFEHVTHESRRGFAGAVNSAWDSTADCDYILHMEDDFLFNRFVPIGDMIEVLGNNSHLIQMALLRQPVNHEEIRDGGLINRAPDQFHMKQDGSNKWMEHRRFYTTNPSLVPAWVRDGRRFEAPESEGKFSIGIFSEDPTYASGYWGWGEEWVTHIGDLRTGEWVA